jgi:hypothetical protein
MQAWELPSPRRLRETCLLMSLPVRDPVMGAAGKATPKVRRLGAPEARWLGACLLALGPWLAL